VNKEKAKKDPVIFLLDIIIISMIFVIIAVGIRLVATVQYRNTKAYFMEDASTMAFDLKENYYSGLIQGKYMNEINGNYEAKSYHALADYVEALSKYKVYKVKGYNKKALQQQEIMAGSRNEMGDLTIFADKVDKMFEVVD